MLKNTSTPVQCKISHIRQCGWCPLQIPPQWFVSSQKAMGSNGARDSWVLYFPLSPLVAAAFIRRCQEVIKYQSRRPQISNCRFAFNYFISLVVAWRWLGVVIVYTLRGQMLFNIYPNNSTHVTFYPLFNHFLSNLAILESWISLKQYGCSFSGIYKNKTQINSVQPWPCDNTKKLNWLAGKRDWLVQNDDTCHLS